MKIAPSFVFANAAIVFRSSSSTLRYSELRLLRWGQVDLKACTLTVGQSKTESGTGRLLPLNDRAVAILGFSASLFPERESSHFVFPTERYGASGDGTTVVYDCDPTKTDWPLEGSVGISKDSFGCFLMVPRLRIYDGASSEKMTRNFATSNKYQGFHSALGRACDKCHLLCILSLTQASNLLRVDLG